MSTATVVGCHAKASGETAGTLAGTFAVSTFGLGVTKPGDVDTPYGPARITAGAPDPLTIHRMAKTLWLPVLVMGPMALAAGLIIGLVTSSQAVGTDAFRAASAWAQGTLFLGEGLLLSGISLLLGAMLSSLRRGGHRPRRRRRPDRHHRRPARRRAGVRDPRSGLPRRGLAPLGRHRL